MGSSSLTKDQTWASWHWECRVLVTGPPSDFLLCEKNKPLSVKSIVRFLADKCGLVITQDSIEVHSGERIEMPERALAKSGFENVEESLLHSRVPWDHQAQSICQTHWESEGATALKDSEKRGMERGGVHGASNPPNQKHRAEGQSARNLSVCNLTPMFIAIDPTLHTAAAGVAGEGLRLWQLFV